MGNLPDNKKPEDKYYLGYFLKDSLIAVLDLVENFPSSKICFIGFFMLKKELQGKGIASKIIRELENELEKNKFKKIMLGYVEGNKESEKFWFKNGYKGIGKKSKKDCIIIDLLEKNLN